MTISIAERTAQIVREVSTLESRGLELLNNIDRVNDVLRVDAKMLNGLGEVAVYLSNGMRKSAPSFSLEAAISLEDGVEQLMLKLRARYDDCAGRRASAARDQRLTDDDGVVDSYDECIEALGAAFDGFAELHETLGEVVAGLEPVIDERFGSAAELIDSIRRG